MTWAPQVSIDIVTWWKRINTTFRLLKGKHTQRVLKTERLMTSMEVTAWFCKGNYRFGFFTKNPIPATCHDVSSWCLRVSWTLPLDFIHGVPWSSFSFTSAAKKHAIIQWVCPSRRNIAHLILMICTQTTRWIAACCMYVATIGCKVHRKVHSNLNLTQ